MSTRRTRRGHVTRYPGPADLRRHPRGTIVFPARRPPVSRTFAVFNLMLCTTAGIMAILVAKAVVTGPSRDLLLLAAWALLIISAGGPITTIRRIVRGRRP